MPFLSSGHQRMVVRVVPWLPGAVSGEFSEKMQLVLNITCLIILNQDQTVCVCKPPSVPNGREQCVCPQGEK